MHYEFEIYSELVLLLLLISCMRQTLDNFSVMSGVYCFLLLIPSILWPLYLLYP